MILPIVAYGDPVLKKKAAQITAGADYLPELINNMFETMYTANGVGLAAPQIGESLQLFVVDASPFAELEEGEEEDPMADGCAGFKRAFINPVILEESGEKWAFREGCLSIPGIREEVIRHETIKIRWNDEHFNSHEDQFSGYIARVIQHEYDHLQGVLFTEKINPFRRRMLKSKLSDIGKGKVKTNYAMRFK